MNTLLLTAILIILPGAVVGLYRFIREKPQQKLWEDGRWLPPDNPPQNNKELPLPIENPPTAQTDNPYPPSLFR